MVNKTTPYKLEISDGDGNSISFTPRMFGEVGKDIVAVKLALGVLLDMQGLIGQNREDAQFRQPMDENGWFDCTSGQQISLELAATFDSKLQTALVNYQMNNQFLIISYLFGKYGVPGIIDAVGEDFVAESKGDQAEYIATILAQIDSMTNLFDTELGTIGEATLAVMHGWVPHSVAGEKSYYHTQALLAGLLNSERVFDIVPWEIVGMLRRGAFGQRMQDMLDSNILSPNSMSTEPERGPTPQLTSYLLSVPEDKRWLGENATVDFEYGYVGYKSLEGTGQSVLYRSTLVVIQNYLQTSLNQEMTSGPSSIEKMRKAFYPDPFSTSDMFYINEHVSGFYLDTGFTLSPDGPLPMEDEESIKNLEELALDQILDLLDKPKAWVIPRMDKLSKAILFGVGEVSDTELINSAEFFPPEQQEKYKRQVQRFLDLEEQIQRLKEEIRTIPEPSSTFASAAASLGNNNANQSQQRDFQVNLYNDTRRASLQDRLQRLEDEYAIGEITLEEKRKYFLILATSTALEYLEEHRTSQSSHPSAHHWREVDNISTNEPLIRFIEYKTPSMRPGQTYRALMEVSNKKLELITENKIITSDLVEDTSSDTDTSSESASQEFCLNDTEEKTIRDLEEYRAHARRRRREIVRQLRDTFKEEPALRGPSSITGGQIGPFDFNRALSDLMGFNINGASDYEYTKGVLSRLGDVGTAALESLGVLDTDIDYFNNIANKSNQEITKKDIKGKPINDVIQITIEEFDERVETIIKDLQESAGIISSEGIAFKKGSDFNAQKEAGLLKQFASQFKDLLLESAEESYGSKVSELMKSNPDKAIISAEFTTVLAPGKEPYMGPKFGKKIVGFGLQLPEDFTSETKLWPYLEKKPSEFKGAARGDNLFLENIFATEEQIKKRKEKINKSKVLSRGRTVNYIRNIYEMTGLLTDKPNEVISVFDDGRGACKDLGINLDKKLASSYIAKHTTGIQVQHPPGDADGFSWKEFSKKNFVDPAKAWGATSAKNWENSWNDTFDGDAALKLLGDMCTLEDLYTEFFDKLDLVSLLCDWLKCIRLPNFNLKLPNFYLPPLPTIPILGWYAALVRFLIDNIKQILIRIACTFVRTIIDKLSIPFCEEQLRDFIAAGSLSGSPIIDQALADALTNTGIPGAKSEQAKAFFDDVANITTGEELCHLLSGRPLDDASMAMIQRLIEKNDLAEDLDSQDAVMNYFDLLGTLMPGGICEELQKSTTLSPSKSCVEISDYLQDIRNRLQTGDSTLSDEEIDRVVQMAKNEMERKKEELMALSGNDMGNLLPEAYAPGNPNAIISSYPDFIKQELETTIKNSFSAARTSYVSAMDSYVPSMSMDMPSIPRAGYDNYTDIQMLNFEASLNQLAMYAQSSQEAQQFGLQSTLRMLGLPLNTRLDELEIIIQKRVALRRLVDSAITWITLHNRQMHINRDQYISGDGEIIDGERPYRVLSRIFTNPSYLEHTNRIRLTSFGGGDERDDNFENSSLIPVQDEYGNQRYYGYWGKYHERLKTLVTERVPDWLQNMRDQHDGVINAFDDNFLRLSVRQIDSTIEKVKQIIIEYMNKSGHKHEKNINFEGFATGTEWGSILLEDGEGWHPALRAARNKYDDDWTMKKEEYYWGESRAVERSASDLWWFHSWSKKCISDDLEEWNPFGPNGCEFDAWRYKEYLYYGEGGDSMNYTEQDFINFFIKPGIDSEKKGIEWNDELRSLEVLRALRDVTHPDSDFVSAAIRGANGAAGVTWSSAILLYSVFETEKVELQSDPQKSHTVFKRATLPVTRSVAVHDEYGERTGFVTPETWENNNRFITYYRRPYGEGTVSDYVDGERTYVYDNPDDSAARYIPEGAIYKGVFNSLTEENPFPVSLAEVSYDQYFESMTNPLDKTEYTMIIPSYVSTNNPLSEGNSNAYRVKAAFDAMQYFGIYDSRLTDDAVNESDWLETFAENDCSFFSPSDECEDAMEEWGDQEETRRIAIELGESIMEILPRAMQFAQTAVSDIKEMTESKYHRNDSSTSFNRISNQNAWFGVDPSRPDEHFNYIKTIVDNKVSMSEQVEFAQASLKEGFLLQKVFNNNKEAIRKNPHLAYQILSSSLDQTTGGILSVLDPARSGTYGVVPIFPLSMVNSALPNEGDNWFRHTYETMTNIAIHVFGSEAVKEIVIAEGTITDEDKTSDEFMHIFSDLTEAQRLEINPRIILNEICSRLESKRNNPNLIRLVENRVKQLTDTITSTLEYRPTALTAQHLVLLKQVFESRELMSIVERAEEDTNDIKLKVDFGLYSPEIIYKEEMCSKNYDKYTVEVKSDFHLRQPTGTYSKSFEMWERLPDSLTFNNSETGMYFSKREAFANAASNKIKQYLGNTNTSRLKRHLYKDGYLTIRNQLFKSIHNKMKTSMLFDYGYAENVDRRLSAEPIITVGNRCIRNRYGLVESAVISFNKVILEETSEEVMKEMSKPENSPFNRDFDDPTPLDLALQSIATRAYVRVCLIDTLLKGGLAYSIWDIEPVISNNLFRNYVFEHIHQEIQSEYYFSSIWRKSVEKAMGITNPVVALKKMIEEEIVKLPDYCKQVFNYQNPNYDYHNWHLLGDNLIKNETNWTYNHHELMPFGQLEQIAEARSANTGDRVLEEWLQQIENSEGRVDLLNYPPEYNTGENPLRIEHYIKISGELATNASQIFEQVKLNYFDRLGPGSSSLDSWDLKNAIQDTFELSPHISDEIANFMSRGNVYLPPTNLHQMWRVNDGETYVTSPPVFDQYLYFLYNGLDRQRFLEIIKNSTIKQGARLVMITNSPQSLSAVKQIDTIRRDSYLSNCFLGFHPELAKFSNSGATIESVKIPLVEQEHQLRLEDCGFPSGNVFAHTRLSGQESGGLQNTARHMHVDYVNQKLFESTDFINMLEHVFPIRRYMAINSMFATGVLSGYNGLPTLLDHVKTSISFVSKLSSTPKTQRLNLVQIEPEQFAKTALSNWPSHPQSSDCFDFPALPGAEFFKKFFKDLWELIKQLPSILFRGVANQLDPAYKEMRQHYLNCDIKHLTWEGIDFSSFDYGGQHGLVNGVLFKQGGWQHGQEQGKYVPILPAVVPDMVAGTANAFFGDFEPLGRTIARTVTYAFNGMAPFIDPSMAFQLPCAGINQDLLKNEKWDAGGWGRYGHPLSPFTILALSTPQLESDKKLKEPNCSVPKVEQATFDDCDD